MVGVGAYDTLDWHDHLLAAGIASVGPCNAQTTDDPLDIEYRVEDYIEDCPDDGQLIQSTLDQMSNRRTGIKWINEAVNDCGLGRTLHVRLGGTHELDEIVHNQRRLTNIVAVYLELLVKPL